MEDDEDLLPIDDEDETSEEEFRDMDTSVGVDEEKPETDLSDSFFSELMDLVFSCWH